MIRDHQVWLESLDETERAIASAALRAHKTIVQDRKFVGGCYLLTFFLTQYLWCEKCIHVTPVVGWVNDGTSRLMASHAWLESSGKKTDISLTRTEFPEIQPPGALIVLDRVLLAGKCSYTYHRQRPRESFLELEGIDPDIVEYFERRHSMMESVSKTDAQIEAYLSAAPSEFQYTSLAKQMR